MNKSKIHNTETIVSDDQTTILKSAEVNVLSSAKCPDILSEDKAKDSDIITLKPTKVTSPSSETFPTKNSYCVEDFIEKESLPKSKHENNELKLSEVHTTILKSAETNILLSEV